jgi:hypothetical protein
MTTSEPVNWLVHAAVLAVLAAGALAIGSQDVRSDSSQRHDIRVECEPSARAEVAHHHLR